MQKKDPIRQQRLDPRKLCLSVAIDTICTLHLLEVRLFGSPATTGDPSPSLARVVVQSIHRSPDRVVRWRGGRGGAGEETLAAIAGKGERRVVGCVGREELEVKGSAVERGEQEQVVPAWRETQVISFEVRRK